MSQIVYHALNDDVVAICSDTPNDGASDSVRVTVMAIEFGGDVVDGHAWVLLSRVGKQDELEA